MKKHTGAFDGLRLVAAFSVLFAHSYALTLKDVSEPLASLTQGGVGSGEAAVYAFFALSGFLVTKSWMSDPSLRRFMIKRLLRIIPALAFVIIASFAFIGPLTTNLSLTDYFSQWRAWTYLTKILIYPSQYELPGTFATNPFANIVNGSLWTLRLEFALYISVAALGCFGLLRSRKINIALTLVCFVMSIALSQHELISGIPFLHQITAFFLNAVPFFVGGVLAQSNLNSKWLWCVTAVLAVFTFLLVSSLAFKFVLLLALPMTVILIARHGNCDLTTSFGDYSYGIYL